MIIDVLWKVSSSLDDQTGWARSSSTALCPGEAAKAEQFLWREDKLDVLCQ